MQIFSFVNYMFYMFIDISLGYNSIDYKNNYPMQKPVS